MPEAAEQPQSPGKVSPLSADARSHSAAACLQRAKAWAERISPQQTQAAKALPDLLGYAAAEQVDLEGYADNDIPCDLYASHARDNGTVFPDFQDADSAANTNKVIRAACALLEDHREALNATLADRGFAHSPRLEYRSGGGRGNKSKITVRWETICPSAPPSTDTGPVHFDVTESARPELLVRAFIWPLTQRRIALRALYLLPLVAVLSLYGVVAAALLGQAGIHQPLSIASLLWVAAAIGAIAFALWLTRPFFAAVRYGWAALPFVLQNEHDDLVLAFHRHDSQAQRTMRVQRYTTACPFCQATMRVRRLPGAPSHHLVGLCDVAPYQHQVRFDPVSRKGGSRSHPDSPAL